MLIDMLTALLIGVFIDIWTVILFTFSTGIPVEMFVDILVDVFIDMDNSTRREDEGRKKWTSSENLTTPT